MTIAQNLAAGLGSGIGANLAGAVESLIGMFDVAAFTAGRALVSAGNTRSLQCWLNPAHLLDQATGANQCAAPSANSLINGLSTISYTGAQRYLSTMPAAFWAERHKGNAWQELAVFVPRQASTGNALNTLGDTTSAVSGRSGAILSYFGPTTNAGFVSIQNASTAVAGGSAFGAVTKDVATWIGFSAAAGVFTRHVKSNAAALTTLATPLNDVPANTLQVGLRHSGTQPAELDLWGLFYASAQFSAQKFAAMGALLNVITGVTP